MSGAMSGAIIAAIDLGPSSARVLRHAAGFARLWSAPLTVLHVCAGRSTGQRERVIDFCSLEGPYEVDIDEARVVVRPGHVSEIIRRQAARDAAWLVVIGCGALAEGAGLVVIGLRTRGQPGTIASAVLKTNRPFVLAVPGC